MMPNLFGFVRNEINGSLLALETASAEGAVMSRAQQYRHLEDEVRKRAAAEPTASVKAEWNNLADMYGCLAEQSEAADALTYDPFRELIAKK